MAKGVPCKKPFISNTALKRLAQRAGVTRISKDIFDMTRQEMVVFLQKIMTDVILYAEHAKRKTVTVSDVTSALKRHGRTLYTS